MPSLRRTLSSPSVRSSPYPSSFLASANSSALAARNHGHGQRRSSGSETAVRRVLADIEWWKVADGQCDFDADQEPEASNSDDHQVQQGLLLGSDLGPTDGGVERPSAPSWAPIYPSSSPLDVNVLPTERFAALSLAPETPPRKLFSLAFSPSSVESTPEAGLGFQDSGKLCLDNLDLLFPEISAGLSMLKHSCTLLNFPGRDLSDDIFSHDTDATDLYADFVHASPSLSSPF